MLRRRRKMGRTYTGDGDGGRLVAKSCLWLLWKWVLSSVTEIIVIFQYSLWALFVQL